MNWTLIVLIGAGVGFVAGMFGKGGSAIATPLLHAAGVPAMVALAAPLPATIPSTAAASLPYLRYHLVERDVVRWSLLVGLPATAAGALATRWISGTALVHVTDVVVIVLGLRSLARPGNPGSAPGVISHRRVRLAATALVVGLASGLLANSGGFLLVPLYLAVVHLPMRSALANSLAVAMVLAVPGTIVHAALGHIDWHVVVVFGMASIPLSNLGARTALRLRADRLERLYGVVLVTLGAALLAAG